MSVLTDMWKKIFSIAKLGDDIDKPLTPQILSDPSHKVTQHLLYIYSMETFIYGELNRASRKKDESKIQYYGAFSAALSYIIYSANTKRKTDKLTGTTTLYRGSSMTREQFDSY